MNCQAFKTGMRAPDDVSAATALMDGGAFKAEHVVAILGKTEGNGAVNDYTRALATLSFQLLLARRTNRKIEEIARRVPIIWSGGTEGLMSPHATIFTREPERGPTAGQKRFTVGTAYTRDLLPEEFGTAVHARVAAEGVRPRDAAGRLKMHPFYVQKLYAQARNYSAEELNGVTLRLAELDHALKGGSRLANDLELERALMEVTRPAA